MLNYIFTEAITDTVLDTKYKPIVQAVNNKDLKRLERVKALARLYMVNLHSELNKVDYKQLYDIVYLLSKVGGFSFSEHEARMVVAKTEVNKIKKSRDKAVYINTLMIQLLQ